jgi:hypothetical protein
MVTQVVVEMTMKTIHHTVFTSNDAARREHSRERVRQRVEKFVNEIGVDNLVSINEHTAIFAPFSVVVWWCGDLPDTETAVIRASDEGENGNEA